MTKQIGNTDLIDTWASEGSIVDPDPSKKEEGWLLGEQPPHEWMNYIQNEHGQKINRLLDDTYSDGVSLRGELDGNVSDGKGARLVRGAVIYADTLADLQALDTSGLADGQSALVNGREYRWDGGSWTPAGSEIYLANDYGFSVENTGSENSDAIEAALEAAKGAPVWVIAKEDFFMERVRVNDMDADLTFMGPGWADGRSGRPRINAYNSHENVLSASLGQESKEINNGIKSYWRAVVSSSEGYNVGDVVRVVSDEVEDRSAGRGLPDEDNSRRMGENATVVAVESDKIFLDNLEDGPSYSTNVRIGKVPGYQVSVKGFKVKSEYEKQGWVLTVASVKNGYFEVDIKNHGGIAVETTGCVDCNFVLSGSGRGGSDEQGQTILGYFINDRSSTRTKIKVFAHGWRHVTTTNITPVAPDSGIEMYGLCRDHTVYDSVSHAPQGSPWDDHSGAIRTIWRNCSAYGEQESTATEGSAFQFRGSDSKIEGGFVDDSFGQTIRVGPAARGRLQVSNLTSTSMVIDSQLDSPSETVLILNDCYFSIGGGFAAVRMMRPDYLNVVINGGEYRHLKADSSSMSMIRVTGPTNVRFNSPLLFKSGDGEGFRFISVSSDASDDVVITGKWRGASEGEEPPERYIYNDSADNMKAYLAVNWVSGEKPTATGLGPNPGADDLRIFTDNDGYLEALGGAQTDDGFRRLFSICQ